MNVVFRQEVGIQPEISSLTRRYIASKRDEAVPENPRNPIIKALLLALSGATKMRKETNLLVPGAIARKRRGY